MKLKQIAVLTMFAGSVYAGSWSYRAWTDDASSGIESNHTYTCAVNMNGSAATINGADFEAYSGTSGTGWSMGGAVSAHSSQTSLITGDSAVLANNGFVYNGNPRTVTLSGLTPGEIYITTFFAFSWDEDSTRIQTFASGSDSVVIDQDEYGYNNGIRIDYTFVAMAETNQFVITPRDSGTFHMSALANHADPSASFIDITNTNEVVGREVDEYTIGGTSTPDITGMMSWHNFASTSVGFFSASPEWQVLNIPLMMGDNTITISGTNTAAETISDTIIITRDIFHGGDSPVHYVSSAGNAVWPYTNLTDAATSIQDAVDVAATGDTVLVADGTYYPASEISVTRAITVKSMNGSGLSEVNGSGAHRCFNINAAAVLDGFTIANGYIADSSSARGGGVYCVNGTIQNCTLSSNTARGSNGSNGDYPDWETGEPADNINGGNGGDSRGGGIYCVYGFVQNCLFAGNQGIGGQGGYGTYDDVSEWAGSGGNGGPVYGGAVYCAQGIVQNCTLSANTATGGNGGTGAEDWMWGGGCDGGDGGSSAGGGVYSDHATVINCVISGNTTTGGAAADSAWGSFGGAGSGGGIYSSRGIVQNGSLSQNTSTSGSGYTYEYDSSYGGDGTGSGGGVYGYRGTVQNTIAWGNTANSEYDDIRNDVATISYCCASDGVTDGTNGCITSNPLFRDASGGDVRLQASSPCIDAGNNVDVTAVVDLDGNRRISVARVDMGAYEWQYENVITVGHSAHGNVDPAGTVTVLHFGSTNFTFLADPYYHAGNVISNGVSLGQKTTFAWSNLTENGTLYVEFSENLATNGTPEWWLAQYGWTNGFDAAALADPDHDGLASWREYELGTLPNNSDSDDDSLDDGIEVGAGSDPVHDDSAVINSVLNNSADFGLYTESALGALAVGSMQVGVSNSTVNLHLQLLRSDDLTTWTNAGNAVEWQAPAGTGKQFYKVRAAE